MSEGRIEGVRIDKTGNKQWERDYRLSDIETVFRRREWQNWDEVIRWLEENGDNDHELTPGEVIAMREDLERLKDTGVAFTRDPGAAYTQAHKYRHNPSHPRNQ